MDSEVVTSIQDLIETVQDATMVIVALFGIMLGWLVMKELLKIWYH